MPDTCDLVSISDEEDGAKNVSSVVAFLYPLVLLTFLIFFAPFFNRASHHRHHPQKHSAGTIRTFESRLDSLEAQVRNIELHVREYMIFDGSLVHPRINFSYSVLLF